MNLEELPMDTKSRQSIVRKHRAAADTQKQSSLRGLHLITNRFDGQTDVHFTPLTRDTEKHGIIVMFEVQPGEVKKPAKKSNKARPATKKTKKRR